LGFKNRQFSRIIKIVSSIWQKFKKDHASWNVLVAHLRIYKGKKYPYDQPYAQDYDISIIWWNLIEPEPKYLQELALKILAIVPNKRLEKEEFNKDELLSFNNLDFSESYMTRKNLVLFLEENLDLNDKIFINDLENFPDIEDNNEDLLLENNEIIKNMIEQTSQISGHDDYNWDLKDYLNSDND
ncbi:3006_t:CDS:2, partial [Cetraspora pellucida]